ncbi:PAS domain-containing protein [Spirosoma aureum]|uniref:histidine kinase n=1 Tax=Spirosoma aureum TaxID=2692134 RepID=A0A6G9AGU2_9BACT|nr:PAS domain-containing protein [Spirosoma aureum]
MTGSDKPFDKKTPGERLDAHSALQAAGLGVWEVDSQTNHVHWDDRCRELFGLGKDLIVTYQEAVQHIHPEDVDQVNKALNWAMNPESDGVYDQTFRTLGADDGQLRWVRFQGHAYFSEAGKLVIDNGVGFDEKYLDRIFQVFQRLHGRSQFAGSGIGLAICEKVVTNHGGAITASSQPGQGATFSVYLPV